MNAAAGQSRAGGFPWNEVIHAGLGLLRLSPAVFWRLTPRELSALCGSLQPRAKGFDRSALDALMAAFPDG